MSIFGSPTASFAGAPSFSAIHIIRSALAFDRSLENSKIDADQENEFVVLKGSANSFEAIDRAMELARSLTGCQVVNHIQPNY